jgi:hypothetical protein
MTDPQGTSAASACPWCSSDRGLDGEGRCLACGAAVLSTDAIEPMPGVTDVDTLGIIKQRGVRTPNRIVAWVTGDSPDTESWAPAGEALEAPTLDVRREMLKLEFDAAIAAQQAEIDALRADEALAAAERAARAGPQPTTPAEPETAEGGDTPTDVVAAVPAEAQPAADSEAEPAGADERPEEPPQA